MGGHLSQRYYQVALISGYPVLTAVSWSQYGCAISSCTWAPKLARKCEIKHWFPWSTDGRSVGRTVTWLPNFLEWMDFVSYGAPLARLARAWSFAIIIVNGQSAWDVQSHSWHVKVLNSTPFRGSYVREFELSQSNLIKRIIIITHAHSLHVRMLDFVPFTICTWNNANCLRDYFAQTILSNICNKIMHHSMLRTSLFNFQQNCQIAEILISNHLRLFHPIKQSLIISSTGYFQVHSLTLLFQQKLRIFT